MMMIPVNTNVENSQNRDRCQIEKNQVEPIDVNLNSWQSSINSFRNFIGIFLSIQIFKHLFAKKKTASELFSLLCCPHLYVDLVLPEQCGLHLCDVPGQDWWEGVGPGHLPESRQVVTWL